MRRRVRLAPGVRLRASRRDLRASVGTGIERLVVGETPLDPTGARPVAHPLYGPPGGEVSAVDNLPPSTKLVRSQRAVDRLEQIMTAHRREYAVPQPPQRRAVDTADREEQIRREHRELATRMLPWWAARRRTAARRSARAAAEQEIPLLREQVQFEADTAYREALARWEKLVGGDEATVLGQLTRAFEDEGGHAAALGVEDGIVLILVVLPGDDVVPDRMPGTTEHGNLSLTRTTASQRREWYLRAVCGLLAAAGREAVAVCPGVEQVQLVGVRADLSDQGDGPELLVDDEIHGPAGGQRWEALLAVEASREALARVGAADDPVALLTEASEVEMRTERRGGLLPLHPDPGSSVAEVLEHLSQTR